MKKISFQEYDKESMAFWSGMLHGFAKVLKLKSEYEHVIFIQRFEEQFADSCGSKYAIGLNSGTTALELALIACGVVKKDEVILPSYTYPATALAISNIGASPVFVDIKPDALTIDPLEIKKNITKRTKAIIPVHIHGNPCDMEKIAELSGRYGIPIVEDASHAHGAVYNKTRIGNFGVGCFSCHTSKILGALGNAGVLTTNDQKIYRRVLSLIKVDGSLDSSVVSSRTPCRIDALQAAVLSSKLPSLPLLIEKRRKAASLYKQKIGKEQVVFQKEEQKGMHVYRDLLIFSKKRSDLASFLMERQIETKVRYEHPVHLSRFYQSLGYKAGSLPVTEGICKEVLCLPCSHILAEDEIDIICKNIRVFLKKTS